MKTKPRKNLKKNSYDNLIDGAKLFVAYWRQNIEIFVEDYLGIKLFLFQKILIHMMSKDSYFVFSACRGIGKSFITAVFCCAMCILYSNLKIAIISGNKKQASAIITEKIAELMHNSPILAKEIIGIKTYHDNVCCEFRNGSKIFAVANNQGSRGHRCNILISEEYRQIDLDILNSVAKPFLTNRRTCPFHSKPEYINYPKEPNKEIYISSALSLVQTIVKYG